MPLVTIGIFYLLSLMLTMTEKVDAITIVYSKKKQSLSQSMQRFEGYMAWKWYSQNLSPKGSNTYGFFHHGVPQ